MGIAWGETGKVNILKYLHDALLLRFGHLLFNETGADGVAAEVGEGDAVLVGEAAPDGAVDFFLEAVAIVSLQVFLGGFETFASHTDSVFLAHTYDVLHGGLMTTAEKEGGDGE